MSPVNRSRQVRLAVLGATGSIGRQALEVAAQHPESISVVLLSARQQIEPLTRAVEAFQPQQAVLTAPTPGNTLPEMVAGIPLKIGREAQLEAISSLKPDVVLNGVSGAAGLQASLRTLEEGLTLALANKESMVMAGELMRSTAAGGGGEIIPVDSEHSAIEQCLRSGHPAEVSRLVLTASGGPFRDSTSEEISSATPEQALAHPNWKMGQKITIDSATLMNKALEVIEAQALFDIPPDRIEVVIHPESIIHSMVEFVDGSTVAQLGYPDMRVPIQYAISHPHRWPAPTEPLDLARLGRLNFSQPDLNRFPALGLAYHVLDGGGTLGAVLNAANEVAVAAFLAGQIGFGQIAVLCERALEHHENTPASCLEAILEADRAARDRVNKWIS